MRRSTVGRSRRRGRGLIALAVGGMALIAGAAPAQAEIKIEQAIALELQQGTAGDVVYGPGALGNRVWGMDGGYGCGGSGTPAGVFNHKCFIYSINLDGSGYRTYQIPDAIAQGSPAGDVPTAADWALTPPFATYPMVRQYQRFFQNTSPFCSCPNDDPPGSLSKPTSSAPYDIEVGPDGKTLWITMFFGPQTGLLKMTPTSPTTADWQVYPMAQLTAAVGRTDDITTPPVRPTYASWPFAPNPYEIETGPDGRIYVTIQDNWGDVINQTGTVNRKRESWILRFDPADPVGTAFSWGVSGMPSNIIRGTDGNMWFETYNRYGSQVDDGGLGRINVRNGSFKFFKKPPLTDHNGNPAVANTSDYMAFAPDGKIWFTQEFQRGLSSFDPKTGEFEKFREGFPGVVNGAGNQGTYGLQFGYDGKLYNILSNGDAVRFDTEEGKVLQVIDNPADTFPGGLKLMPDGTMWFGHHIQKNVQKITGIPDLREKAHPRPRPKDDHRRPDREHRR